MDEHIRHLTILDHAYSKDYESYKHAWEHRRVTLIKRILADQVKQNTHGDDVFQIKLEHAPPLWPVVVHQVVTIF
jgi:hypothetical protein